MPEETQPIEARPSYLPEPPTTFDLHTGLLSLKNYDAQKRQYVYTTYIPVNIRLAWFKSNNRTCSVVTEMIFFDADKICTKEITEYDATQRKRVVIETKQAPGMAVFRATVTDDLGNIGTGTKCETGVDFPDYIEKAEKGAIGRALACLGYGTMFEPEGNSDEANRPADSPVTQSRQPGPNRPVQQKRPQQPQAQDNQVQQPPEEQEQLATSNQIAVLIQYRDSLGEKIEPFPENMTSAQARERLREYKRKLQERKGPEALKPAS